MSDLKVICPACESYSSSVGVAWRDGGPCPFCGLPADAALELERARTRGAEDRTVKIAAEALARAAKAEAEAGRLRGLLREIGWTAARADKEEG